MSASEKFKRPQVTGIDERVIVKWSRDVLDEGFLAVPKRLIRCLPRLFTGNSAIRMLQAVLAVADTKHARAARQPSLDYLAFIAGVSPDEFRQALSELEAANLIKVSGDDTDLNVSLQPLLDSVMRETVDKD